MMHDTDLERVATNQPVAVDHLRDLLEALADDLTDSLDDYLDAAWHQVTDHDLLAETARHYVFAVPQEEWDDLAERHDLDDDEKRGLRAAHQKWARDLLVTTDASPKAFDGLDALVVPFPDNWAFSQEMMTWQFGHLVTQGLSAAEALDYWVVECAGFADAKHWAKDRGVGAEAVRKNIRQAREKLD